jgi:hypothetical protein
LRRSNPGLLRRCGRLIFGHPVAGHCLLGHPVDVRCRYRHAGPLSVSDCVGHANRHANANGLRDRHAVTQPIRTVTQPIRVPQPIQAVSDARAQAIAHSVRDTERPALSDQIRLAAARHSRLARSDLRT